MLGMGLNRERSGGNGVSMDLETWVTIRMLWTGGGYVRVAFDLRHVSYCETVSSGR